MIKFSDYQFHTFLTSSGFENWQLVNQLLFNITSYYYSIKNFVFIVPRRWDGTHHKGWKCVYFLCA